MKTSVRRRGRQRFPFPCPTTAPGKAVLVPALPLPSPAPGFGVSVPFLGAGKAAAMSSCPARHTLLFSEASGISHPERFEAHCFGFYFSVAALLIEVKLASRSVVVIPCIRFYCVQLHLRGDISASRFLVGLCVCERAGEDAVEKIKKPVTTDGTDKKNSRFLETVLADVV